MRIKSFISILTLLLLCLAPHLYGHKVAAEHKPDAPVKIGYIDFAPIFFKTPDGRPDGSFIDIIRLWSHRNEIPIKLVYFDSWANAVKALDNDNIDLLPGMYRTAAREKKYLISKPLTVMEEYLFIRNDVDRDELNGAVFGVISDSYREKWLRKDYPLGSFKVFKTPQQLISAFLRNKIQVFAMNHNSGLKYLKQAGLNIDHQFRIQPYRTLESCVAAKLAHKKLMHIFNQGLEVIGENAIDSILKAWRSDDGAHPQILHRSIKMVYAADIAPYQYTDETGGAAGYCVEYWRRFSQETNIKINFIAAKNWGDSLNMLKKGMVDIHCGMLYSKERAKKYSYTQPYLFSNIALYVDDSISGIDSLNDVAGFVVGCEKNSIADKILAQRGILSQPFNNSKDMIDSFLSGKIKVILMLDEIPQTLQQQQFGKVNFYKVLLKKQYSWHGVTLKNNEKLVEDLSKMMENISLPRKSRSSRHWTIGVPLGQPPLSFATKEGAILGAIPDFWRKMAEQNGCKVKFVIGNWLQLRQWLKDDRIDFIGISPGSYNEAAWLRSAPFGIVCDQQLYQKDESGRVKFGLKYGVLLPSSVSAALQFPSLRLQTFNSEKQLIDALDKGEISGFFIDTDLKDKVVRYYLLDYQLNPVKNVSFKNNYMVLYSSSHGLPESIRKILSDKGDMMKLRQTIKSWQAESVIPWKQILTLTMGGIVFLTILLLWIFQLKREIRRRVDITSKLREREVELRQQQDQYQMVEYAASMGTWTLDMRHRKLSFNETAMELLEIPSSSNEMLLEDEFMENVHPDDRHIIIDSLENNINAPLIKMTFRYIKPDKEILWLHSFSRVTGYDKDGFSTQLTGFIQDITARVKAEEENRRQHMLIDSLVRNIPFGLACCDPENDLKYIYWNPGMEFLTGIDSEEAIGHNLDQLSLDGFDSLSRDINLVLSQCRQIENTREISLHNRKFHIRFCSTPILNYNNKINLIVTMLEDVTDKVNLDERYRLSQKMEALGRLAGGVAHDFNNFLQTIHGHAEMLRDAALPAPYDEDVKEIISSAERGAALTAQLLIFSHTDSVQKKRIELNQFIADMFKVIKRLVRSDIKFSFDKSEDEVFIYGAPGPIGQIILNLCLNSSDAAGEGNAFIDITVSTKKIEDPHLIKSPDAKAGKYALLSVADNGRGISIADQMTIFDPFFTTKTPNEGTGMGLATVYAVVKSHEGFIELKSHPGDTVFNVYIPITTDVPKEQEDASSASVEKKKTILLAEDEQSIRAMAARILSQAGYRIIEAADGNAAVAQFNQNRDHIDLLITDAIMPGKTGQSVARIILEEKPDTPVILCSGYTQAELEADDILNKNCRILNKPYGIHELLVAVRDTLGPPGEKRK